MSIRNPKKCLLRWKNKLKKKRLKKSMRIKRIGVSAFVFSNIDRLQAPYCRLLSRQSRRSIAVRVGLKKS